MAENKNQHVVPRSYLAQFVDPESPADFDPFTWVYERGEEPYRKSPKKLTVQSYYYSWTDATTGERHDDVDQLLQVTEDAGIPILKRLAEGRNPASFTAAERQDFATFAGFLSVRIPRFRDSTDDSLRQLHKIRGQLIASTPGYMESLSERMTQDEGGRRHTREEIESAREFLLRPDIRYKIDPRSSLLAMLHAAPVAAEFVATLPWRVLLAPRGERFVAGDTPIAKVTTHADWPQWWGVGWETPYMEATLPLSPAACLLVSVHHPEGVEQVTSDIVREVNLRTASLSSTVFSSKRIEARVFNKPAGWTWWTPVSAIDPEWLAHMERMDDDHDEPDSEGFASGPG